ncbi:MAG: hypothetical protein LBL75_03075 [Rickettsiales bacterium]|jgi:hypothetical protein|nr:hypothetical protein [Rickettsiales bacterium]
MTQNNKTTTNTNQPKENGLSISVEIETKKSELREANDKKNIERFFKYVGIILFLIAQNRWYQYFQDDNKTSGIIAAGISFLFGVYALKKYALQRYWKNKTSEIQDEIEQLQKQLQDLFNNTNTGK